MFFIYIPMKGMIINMDEYFQINQKILYNEPMKKHTSFKIGGNADLFISVQNEEELKQALNYAKQKQIPVTIIGNGSNILVSDEGIKGLVIKIDIQYFGIQNNEDEFEVIVGSGNKMMALAIQLKNHEISGFEQLSGIPGTIGGAIYMNAGAYGKEMKDIVLETTYIDRDGNIHKINNSMHQFEYRKSIFSNNDYIILETIFILNYGVKEQIKAKMTEYMVSRTEKQPIELPSAGSSFKRGTDFITAKLIDECGLKGFRIGDAEVSKKHAGFIVNLGNATAKDVLELIIVVKNKVYEKTSKEIELEIQIMGEK